MRRINPQRTHRLCPRGSSISAIIKILNRESTKFITPSVSEISEKFGRDPFFVLISCILSLRTLDKTTRQASYNLFRLASSPSRMLKLSLGVIEKAIYPVGFYHTKAKTIKGICTVLVDRFSSQVPDNLDELLSLNGVGRKTANLVLTEGFGRLGICVDTHVHRITNRLGYCRTNNPEDTEACLRQKLPKKYWREYNRLLVSWGQNVCRPISPLCIRCAIKRYCLRRGVKVYR